MFVLILFSLCSSEKVCPESTTITLDAEAIKGYTSPKYHDCDNLGRISFTFAQGVEAAKKVIPKMLFSNCQMSSITIGKEVTKIGEYAFSKCTIDTITLDTSAESKLDSIAQHAFEYLNYKYNSYESTVSISFPPSLKTIGENAFEFAYLNSVTFSFNEPKLHKIEDYAFRSLNNKQKSTISMRLPESLVTIGKYAFQDSYLSSISLDGTEPSLGTIDEYAFQYCGQLDLSNSFFNSATQLTKIGSFAFYEAGSSISSTFTLIIPHLLTKIESSSFYGTKIYSILIDEDHQSELETIESSAFAYTHYLSSNVDLYKATKLTTIKSQAFYDSYSGELYYGYNSENNKEKYTVIFPTSLKTIESEAFTFAYGLSYHKLVFPTLEKATDFGEKAFKGQFLAIRRSEFESITEVNDQNPLVFSENLETIGNSAFEGVQNQNFNIDLSKATKLKRIGDKAFYDCSLSEKSNLHINSDVITEIGEEAFNLKYVEKPDNNGEYPDQFKVKLFFKSLDKITRIGNKAYFKQNVEFPQTISFPNELTEIGDYAFKIYPQSTKAVEHLDTSISSVTFSTKTIPYIGESAFENQKNMVTTDIKAHIIKENAFSSCSNLNANIEIVPDDTEAGSIGANAFKDCVRLAGTLKMVNPEKTAENEKNPLSEIGNMAFQNTGLQSIDLPYMKLIGVAAFERCFNLNAADPKVLKADKIENYAFMNCFNLEFSSITANYIGTSAFENCHNLGADITIFFNLDENYDNARGFIGERAFYYCKKLGSLNYNLSFIEEKDGYEEQIISDEAFAQSGLNGDLSIPFLIKEIGSYAFDHCSSLTGLTIESNITTRQVIKDHAFYYSGLSKPLNIPKSVVQIQGYAFSFTNIESLTVEGTSYADLVIIDGNNVLTPTETDIQNYAFYSCKKLSTVKFDDGYIKINSNSFKCCPLKTVNLGKITSIPSEAFYGMKTLGTIAIPDTVTSIGSKAFAECTGLTAVNYGTYPQVNSIGSNAFYRCTSLQNTKIPPLVSRINQYTFYRCEQLKTFEIPETVTSIDQYAFYRCAAFSGPLNVPAELTSIGDSAFRFSGISGSLNFPDSLQTIGPNAFNGCDKLNRGLSFGRSIAEIGKNAFLDCSGFTDEITFPDYLTNNHNLYIDEGAFDGCSGFKGNLRLPRGTILGPEPDFGSEQVYGKNAFRGCSGFDGKLYLPESIENVPEGTFSGCSKFIGDIPLYSVTTVGPRAFYDCSGFTGNLDIHGLGTIEEYSFYNCKGLDGQLITNPELSEVKQYALYGCSGLKGQLKAEKLQKVEKYAFAGCSGLNGQLHFSDELQYIEEYAFSDCSGFSEHLSFKVKGTPDTGSDTVSIEQRAFKGCSGFKGGRLTFTLTNKEEQYFNAKDHGHSYYRYDYFLKIGNEAFKDTKFKDIYYLGRFEPDCDYDIGISKIKGIHTSSNYANKTFCNYPLHKNKLSGGAIAGIVIAVIVVVAAIVILIVFLILRMKRNKDQSEAEVEMNQDP
ncbi:hypothetical protein M9Y10_001571 [Tritrichomonas musculus]|uniref:Surface antigen BspA-like n=1 Tax=Tritrichomonas musculus TaxID=1915356 RepID=A0ABR2L7D0_9EUKA